LRPRPLEIAILEPWPIRYIIILQNDDNNNKVATMADEGSHEGTPDEESPADKSKGSSGGARSNDDQAISIYEPEGESSEVSDYEIPLQPLQTLVESVASEEEILELAMPSRTPQIFQTPTQSNLSSFQLMRDGVEMDLATLSIPGSSSGGSDSFTSIPSSFSDFGAKVHPREDSLPVPLETPTQSNLSSRKNHLEANYQSGAHPSSIEDSERRAVSFQPMRGGVEMDPAILSIPGSSSGGSDSFTSIPSSISDFGPRLPPREDSQVRENNRMSFTVDLETGKEGGRGRRALVRVRWFAGSA
jgi:hypothetical protein